MTVTDHDHGARAQPPRRRGFWADARFFIGIGLIAASIGGVWLVVDASRQTTPVLAATKALLPGDEVTEDDLRVVEVALGANGEDYLSPGELDGGLVSTRTVGSGELVPADAVGDPADAETTTVVVRSASDVPEGVKAGSSVEVWEAPLQEGGDYGTPRILVADAVVAGVSRDEQLLSSGAAALELVIDRDDVAGALAAVAAESAISVVPTGHGG